MAPIERILVFCSTPDVEADGFVVPILAEPIERLAARAASLGFDGLEFLPDPGDIPEPERLRSVLDAAGVGLGVVNSGRMAARGFALLHRDARRRREFDRDLQALRGPRGCARRPRRARDGARRCVRRGFRARSAGADARRLRRDRRACRAGRDRRDAGAGRSGLRGRRAAGRGGGRAGASRREPRLLDHARHPPARGGRAELRGRVRRGRGAGEPHPPLRSRGTGRREWRRSGSTGTGSGPRCRATASVAPDRWCWRPRATATPRRGRRSPSCGRR